MTMLIAKKSNYPFSIIFCLSSPPQGVPLSTLLKELSIMFVFLVYISPGICVGMCKPGEPLTACTGSPGHNLFGQPMAKQPAYCTVEGQEEGEGPPNGETLVRCTGGSGKYCTDFCQSGEPQKCGDEVRKVCAVTFTESEFYLI